MSAEVGYLLVNTMLLSLITILLEGFVAGSERYRLMNLSDSQPNKSMQRLPTTSQQTSTSASSPDSTSASNTASDPKPETARSTDEEQQQNRRESPSLSDKRSGDKSKPDRAKQSYRQSYLPQIPAIVYILAYISLVFISLFLIFRFRSLIKLYIVAYAIILMTTVFRLLQSALIHTSNFFGSTALTDSEETGLETSSASHPKDLEGRRNLSASTCQPVDNKRRVNNSKKCSMPSKFKNTFVAGLIYGLNLILSATLAYIWYANQLNGCFWLVHNSLGILVCTLVGQACVSVLQLISCRQLFIAFAALTLLDLIAVHVFRTHGVSVLSEIIKEQKLNKRDLNDVEELNVGQNAISQVNLTDAAGGLDKRISQITDQANKLYRIPCVFIIPKGHSLCVDLKSAAKLGFGDLIIAGIIAAFCFSFDKLKRTNPAYFSTSLAASLASLVVMLLVDDLFQANGQPVLAFIVPANLVVLLLLAYHRGESKEFWANACDRPVNRQHEEEVPFEVF